MPVVFSWTLPETDSEMRIEDKQFIFIWEVSSGSTSPLLLESETGQGRKPTLGALLGRLALREAGAPCHWDSGRRWDTPLSCPVQVVRNWGIYSSTHVRLRAAPMGACPALAEHKNLPVTGSTPWQRESSLPSAEGRASIASAYPTMLILILSNLRGSDNHLFNVFLLH